MQLRRLVLSVSGVLFFSASALGDPPPKASEAPPASKPKPFGPMIWPTTGPKDVVDRVAGVVNREIVLLSEVRRRAAPLIARMPPGSTTPPGAETRLLREMLDRIVDEKVIAIDAERQHITVTDAEIDQALRTVAISQRISVAELFKAAQDAKMSETEYRAELRRQLLEQKVFQVWSSTRSKQYWSLPEALRDRKLAEMRREWLNDLKANTYIEVRL